MVSMFTECDADYGRRVAEGLGMKPQTKGAGSKSNGSGKRRKNDPKADSVTSPVATGTKA